MKLEPKDLKYRSEFATDASYQGYWAAMAKKYKFSVETCSSVNLETGEVTAGKTKKKVK